MRSPVPPPLTLSAALLAIGAPAAVAPQIQIGGSNGWIVQGAYDDVTAAVGDVLSFSYTAGYHDVMLIQEGNDECDFSGGSLLDETGSFQFDVHAELRRSGGQMCRGRLSDWGNALRRGLPHHRHDAREY